MKILHILNHVRQTGNGIVNVAVDLACLQAQKKNEVYVASAGGEYVHLLKQHHVKHIYLDQTRRPLSLFKSAKSYMEAIQTIQPDIVHGHMMTGILLARLFKPLGHYSLISTVHNEFQKSSTLMGLADRVIAVSDAVAVSMRNRGIKHHKLRVVRNGTLGSPRTKLMHEYTPIAIDHPAIVTIAGMYERKGIAELIYAFEKIASCFPDVQLYLVGDGPDREKFERLAQETNVNDRIHFEGFQSQPQRYLLSADIFVLVSHQDPCPLVLIEAREAGCAIVGSRVDGIPELLDGGKAGILLPPKSPDALAEALTQLITSHRLLNQFKNKAKSNLGWLSANRVVEETLKIYSEVT